MQTDHTPEDRSVAIVGASCRLPGGISTLEHFWQALVEGRDLVGKAPSDRFDLSRFTDTELPRPGKSYTDAGGYLEDLAGFDAAHFGISPKEATQMDPQHRLLLELAAEALDHAAIAPEALAGSDTAVYVGISDASYGGLQLHDPRKVNAYTMSGAANSIAANRISYSFDLRGPSMAIDTACSSALVALDQACRAVLDGVTGMALCGGVNALVSPYHYVGFCQAAMLSKRGKCAAFSADADGFVRAEGGGVLVLKRLADARADGDRVLGVILGSGTNSDGRTMGLAVPSAQAQEQLLREVYQRAGADPDELAYFEAHGTGTPVGDPIECTAIGKALGRRRSTPLPIGSAKSNVGHLEPASGIVGVLKTLLVLRHRHIPATLHTQELNPDIDFAGLGLSVATVPSAIPGDGRILAGVNSFGFGGANAHLVLASVPEPEAVAHQQNGPLPVLVTATSPEALTAATTALAERLREATDFSDLAYTSCLRRGRHAHRVAVLAADAEEAAHLLPEAVPTRGVQHGRIGFVFSGNGAQWAGMGLDLLEDKDFRDTLEQADAALRPHLGWSVLERLHTVTAAELAAAEIAQPLLFAVQAGLVSLLRANGIRPATTLGHSVGEIAAAWTAGALTLEQAALVVTERSRAQAVTAGTGRMAAVALPAEKLPLTPGLSIAAHNSARNVTVAGPAEEVTALLAELKRREVTCTDVGVDYAYHAAAMDPVREPLHAALAGLATSPANIPLISTVTGTEIRGEDLDAGYWWRNVREPVRFAEAVTHALDRDVDVLVEIGPHPVLGGYLRALTGERPQRPSVVVPTLHREQPGPAALRTAVATTLAAGGQVDWNRYFTITGRVVDLPTYPWQRRRHWRGEPEAWLRTSGDGRIDHPMLGERLPSPTPLWHGPVEPTLVPWLTDHRLGGLVVMPAAGFAEMALSAGARALGHAVEARHLDINRPLVVPWPDAASVHTQVSVTPDGVVRITSTQGADPEPRPHVRGRVRTLLGAPPPAMDVAAVRARLPRHADAAEQYAALDVHGLSYGPAFQVLTELRVGDGEVLAAYRHEADAAGFVIHPALLDGALQAGAPLISGPLTGQVMLPAALDAVRVWRTPTADGLVHVRERFLFANEACWEIVITDPDGTVAVEIDGARLRRMAGAHQTGIPRHHTVLRAAPRLDEPVEPSPLPCSAELGAGLEARLARLRDALEPGLVRSLAFSRELLAHRLTEAIVELLAVDTTEFSAEDLLAAGVQPRHLRLVRLLAPVGEEYGLLSPAGDDRWRLCGRADPDDAMRRAVATIPAATMELLTGLAVTADLSRLLTGERDGLEVMAGEEASRLLAQFFDVGTWCHFHHSVLQMLLQQIVSHWPEDRPLRVLEVGAGTGGLTATVLPVLPAERTRYVFTDVSPYFLAKAEQRFAEHGWVEYRTFDLDRDPVDQGFALGSFDLVLASNALHSAKDLAKALTGARSLLAPGGRLLAVEAHNQELIASIFGLLDSFWAGEDRDLRPQTVLLPGEQWPGLLRRSGFTDVLRTGGTTPEVRESFSVLLATATTAPAPHTLPTGDPDAHWLLLTETAAERELAERTVPLLTSAALGTPAIRAADEWLPDESDPHIVVLLGEVHDSDTLVERTTRCLTLLRRIAGHAGQGPVWLVTRPCGALPGNAEYSGDAAVWGAARVLATESRDRQIRRISLARTGDAAHRLAAELLSPSAEDEVVLTPAGRFVPREQDLPATVDSAHYRLEIRSPGLSYKLVWSAMSRPEPGPGQVRIAVRAVGLNYRDIMQATGFLPAESHEHLGEFAPGLECVGVITAVGAGTSGVAVGERVAAFAMGCLATEVVVDAHALLPLPDSLSDTEAATMPITFATAGYSLVTLGRLQPGEVVLVHGGAGGVGLAAFQIARSLGAAVIATAGSPAKRALLRALGVEHVLDSRSLDFLPEVHRITGGHGVDVVLNSLAGPAITSGLELLRSGGRFIELGKRDMFEDNAIPLRPFLNNISFHGVDLTMMLNDPAFAERMRTLFTEYLTSADFRPLPHLVYPAVRVAEAFRLLQHSWHVGKVVVTFEPGAAPVVVEGAPQPRGLDPDGVYLVTGGLGGFGAATARWLADRGARRLTLVSRRGTDAPEAPDLLADLAARGVQVSAHAVDAADREAMRAVISGLDAPLRGVVHAAMHLDDAPLAELTDERLRAVLRPKLGGAVVLDELTRQHDLDLFLLFSSGTALVGNSLQGPYAAANLFLEALARRRQAQGLPATAVGWGAINGAGYVARNNLVPTLAAAGLESTTPDEALAAAEDLLARDVSVAVIGRFNWPRMRTLLPLLRTPRFSMLIPESDMDGPTDRVGMVQRLGELPPDEAMALITEQVTLLLAEVLRIDPEAIDPHRRIDDYGLDSLMAAELLVAARRRFDVEIPPMELVRSGGTVADITETIHLRLGLRRPERTPA